MFNVGGPEVLVILLLALIVLGPQRLPDAARQVGKMMGEVRKLSNGFQSEVKNAFNEVETQVKSTFDSPPVSSTKTSPEMNGTAPETTAAAMAADKRQAVRGQRAATNRPAKGPVKAPAKATAKKRTAPLRARPAKPAE